MNSNYSTEKMLCVRHYANHFNKLSNLILTILKVRKYYPHITNNENES